MLNQNDLGSLVDDIKSREMLTPQDPKDMSYILNKLCGRRMSIHGFWFHCALYRMHSNPDTYEALTEHASALQPGGDAPAGRGCIPLSRSFTPKEKCGAACFTHRL